MNKTIRYVRLEDNKVIIVPTKHGLPLLDGLKNLTKGEDEIAGNKVLAYILPVNGEVVNFKVTENILHNLVSINVWTKQEKRTDLSLPLIVK